ncbi:MAG: DUF1573 domain-containing protein [Phycisphaera sp. RhM]|nr:DUF1573 domain-containing protein [Phycisphaera sp. RhM]
MSHSVWLYVICVVALAGQFTPASAAPRDSLATETQQSLQVKEEDRFCALESTRKCVRAQGVSWKTTEATDVLEQRPFASFAEIKGAVESLGLHAKPIELNRAGSFYVQRQLELGKSAIGWLPTVDMTKHGGLEIGHFVVLNSIRGSNEAAFVDAESSRVYLEEIESARPIPLLLISSEPIELSSSEIMSTFLTASLQSPWLIGAFAVLAVCLLLKSINVGRRIELLGYTVLVGLLLLTFLSVRVGFGSIEDQPKPYATDGPLQFERTQYDFGELLKGKSDPQRIHLFNTTGSDIQLKELRTDCVCTTATPNETVVPAHGKIGVDVAFSTFLDGDNRYAINAIGLEGQEAHCSIFFKGSSPLNIVPAKHFFGSFSYSKDSTKARVLEVELTHFYKNAIYDVKLGSVEETDPFSISITKVYGENNQHLELEFGLNLKVRYEGFVFQDVPIIVTLAGEPTTTVLNVGADFVD